MRTRPENATVVFLSIRLSEGVFRMGEVDDTSQVRFGSNSTVPSILHGNSPWVDGCLDDWWSYVVCAEARKPVAIIPWWVRGDEVPHPAYVSAFLAPSYQRAWKDGYFFDAYPTLAPEHPLPSADVNWLDPWAAQSYHTVWW
jgi:hypothetical protein